MPNSLPTARYGIYPPGYFQLRRVLGEILGILYELRIDVFADAPFRERLGLISSLLLELIEEDELGLIGATPEQRVAYAEGC